VPGFRYGLEAVVRADDGEELVRDDVLSIPEIGMVKHVSSENSLACWGIPNGPTLETQPRSLDWGSIVLRNAPVHFRFERVKFGLAGMIELLSLGIRGEAAK
jgi:hypothetical protein